MTISKAGRLSPRSFRFEHWHFLIVQNKVLREKISEVSWGAQWQIPRSSHFFVVYARKTKTMKHDGKYLTSTIMKNIQKIPDDIAT